jgi:hypothetical protein
VISEVMPKAAERPELFPLDCKNPFMVLYFHDFVHYRPPKPIRRPTRFEHLENNDEINRCKKCVMQSSFGTYCQQRMTNVPVKLESTTL